MLERMLAGALAAGVLALASGACSEAEEEITATLDCAGVCEDWNDCFADTDAVDVDVSECTDTCEDRADADDAFREAIDACDECLDDAANECGACWQLCPGFPIPLE